MPTINGRPSLPASGQASGFPWRLTAGLGIALGMLLLSWWVFGGTPPKDERPQRYPTKGTLTYNGQPAKGAVVTFWRQPVDKNDWRAVKPQAKVEADGSYQPNSYDLQDGAMEGTYAVTVLWTGEAGGPGPDLLKGLYADPVRPVLTVTIVAGENAIPPIELKGPPIHGKPVIGANEL